MRLGVQWLVALEPRRRERETSQIIRPQRSQSLSGAGAFEKLDEELSECRRVQGRRVDALISPPHPPALCREPRIDSSISA